MAVWRRTLLSSLVAVPLAYAQPASAAWSQNGISVCSAADSQYAPCVATDGAGGAFFGWLDERSGYLTDVAVTRFLSSGLRAPGWLPDGLLPSHYGYLKFDYTLLADGAGGAYMAWTEQLYPGPGRRDVMMQHVMANGAVAPGWGTTGVRVCAAPEDQRKPQLAPDGAGGAFVTWEDHRSGESDIYVQWMNADGTVASGWPADGLPACQAAGDQAEPAIVADGSGGALIAWRDGRGGWSDVFAIRLASTGAIFPGWPTEGAIVCGASGNQGTPVLLPDGAGGAYATWEDWRDGALPALYLQHMGPSGAPMNGWPVDGRRVADAPGAEEHPVLVPSSGSAVIIVWQDSRDALAAADVFAARFGADGSLAAGWSPAGAAICAAPGSQTRPTAVTDGSGGAFVAWTDARDAAATGTDIYAQCVQAAGTLAPGWAADGVPVCVASQDQTDASVLSDMAGGCIAVWSDRRNSSWNGPDIFAFRLTIDGPVPASVSQLSAANRYGQTFLTWTAPPGVGWTYRAYVSSQPLTTASDLLQASSAGWVADSTWCDRRLSVVIGSAVGYAVDSLAPALTSAQGLFVATPGSAGMRYYAVTAQRFGYPENRSVIVGANALLAPVSETVAEPRPVYQRTILRGAKSDIPVEVYTLWTSHQDSPRFPAMANRPGMAFDCGVVRGSGNSDPLVVLFHQRDGDFLQSYAGSYRPDEVRLCLDDAIPNLDANTWWYGYDAYYDVTAYPNPPPMAGPVRDYTLRRTLHTLRWAMRNFACDTLRVYATGYSMGGSGAALLAMSRPDLLAAAEASIALFDFSVTSDPDPLCSFNTGGYQRLQTERLWGPVSAALTDDDGVSIWDRMNMGFMAERNATSGTSPIVAFNGRNDETVGWLQAVGFYRALRESRNGGTLFWDPRTHLTSSTATWGPTKDTRYLWRFRRDLSYPAFSHCSADADPGDGFPANGDTVGTINGFMDWDPAVDDRADHWGVRLSLRDLAVRWGTLVAPESLTVDVTPRRLQAFEEPPGAQFAFSVVRGATGDTVQSGTVTADALGLVTVVGVRVYHSGSTLFLDRKGPPTGVSDWPDPGGTPRIRLARNPMTGPTRIEIVWPQRAPARVVLLDASGRVIRTLVDEPAGGTQRVVLDPRGLRAGIYFVRARQGGRSRVAKVAVLH